MENILKNAFERPHRVLRRVNRYARLLPEVERPHIVQPHDVIRVRVREQHCIQTAEAYPQHLRAEIRRRVDHDVMSVVLQKYRRAQTVIPRITRPADRAFASWRWNAHARAGPKHGDLHWARRAHSAFLAFFESLYETKT